MDFVRKVVSGSRGRSALALVAITIGLTAPVAVGTSARAVPSKPLCSDANPIERANFPAVPLVDNPWLPLAPGTQLVLAGFADRGGGPLPHKVIFTVTDLVKVIDGVANVVVWDQDIQDGELVESELAFFAQDRRGTVWNLGEYPEEYEEGEFVGAPSTWFSGIDDARGGIHMVADPHASRAWYQQGSAPSVDFLDCGRVQSTSERACTPIACFSDLVLVKERSPLEANSGSQLKYHAAGVGVVQVSAVGDREGETLQLVGRRQLSRVERAKANKAALDLERHAYQTNPLYQLTAPATSRR